MMKRLLNSYGKVKLSGLLLLLFIYEGAYIFFINRSIEQIVDVHAGDFFRSGISAIPVYLVALMIFFTLLRQSILWTLDRVTKHGNNVVRNNVFSGMIRSYDQSQGRDGELYAILNEDLETVLSFFSDLKEYVILLAASVGSAIYIFRLDLRIAIILFIVGILLLVYNLKCKGYLFQSEEDLLKSEKQRKSHTNFLYLTIIDRSTGRDFRPIEKYDELENDYRNKYKNSKIMQFKHMVLPYVLGFAQTYLPLLVIYRWKMEITLGELMALLLTVTSFMAIFRSIGDFLAETEKKKAAFQNICPYLDMKKGAEDFRFEEVSSNTVLEVKNFSLNIRDHQIYLPHLDTGWNGLYLIMGEKGRGKTTFLKMLMGYEHSFEGEVKIFGKDLHEVKSIDRRRIAYMKQGSPILDGTVRTILGYLSRTMSTDDMKQLLENVQIHPHDFGCSTYDDLLDSFIEPGKLSDGQRQRLSLAYVFAMDRDLILLDEPTSHLDSGTREKVLDFMEKVAKEKVVIAVSHDEKMRQRATTVIEW